MRIVPTLLVTALAATVVAQDRLASAKPKPTAPESYVRVSNDPDGEPWGLQTAIVRFAPEAGEGELTVDLIGAVHLGTRAYYRKLNRQFEEYDVVLYELVAPEGFEVPEPDRTEPSVLQMIQQLAGAVLGLDFQLDHIDYTAENLVHADMSPAEMAEAIRKRGDDAVTLALGVAADMLRQFNLQEMELERSGDQGEAELIDPFELLLDPEGPNKIKRMFAEELVEQAAGSGLGQTLDRILVQDRNEAAMKEFQRQLARGKQRIAIFYGAAHMPDFEQRLREDFGLERRSVEWRTAWKLQGGQLDSLTRLLELLRKD